MLDVSLDIFDGHNTSRNNITNTNTGQQRYRLLDTPTRMQAATLT